MRKKKIITGILILSSCISLMSGCAKSNESEEEKVSEPKITVKDSERKVEEEKDEIIHTEDSNIKEEEEQSESKMKLEGVTEGLFSVLEIEEEKVKNEFQKWTSKNGYVSASGIVFYDPMWIYFSEDKYSIDGYLIFEQEGNGIRPENEQKKITMDYYKSKRRIEFHE